MTESPSLRGGRRLPEGPGTGMCPVNVHVEIERAAKSLYQGHGSGLRARHRAAALRAHNARMGHVYDQAQDYVQRRQHVLRSAQAPLRAVTGPGKIHLPASIPGRYPASFGNP